MILIEGYHSRLDHQGSGSEEEGSGSEHEGSGSEKEGSGSEHEGSGFFFQGGIYKYIHTVIIRIRDSQWLLNT